MVLLLVVVEGKGLLLDWEGEEGGMGEPVNVFGSGGGVGTTAADVVVVDTPFNKEVAEEAKLHNVEEAVDDEEVDKDNGDDEKEVLDGIHPSLRVVNGSTGL